MAVLLRQRALLVPPPPIALVLPGARATVQVCLSELSVYQREAIEIWATATECLRWRRRAEEEGDDDGDDDEVTRRDPPPLGGPLSKAKRVQARAVFWMPQCLSPSSLSLLFVSAVPTIHSLCCPSIDVRIGQAVSLEQSHSPLGGPGLQRKSKPPVCSPSQSLSSTKRIGRFHWKTCR